MIFYTPALLAAVLSHVLHMEDTLLSYFNKHPAPAFRSNLPLPPGPGAGPGWGVGAGPGGFIRKARGPGGALSPPGGVA